MPIFFVILIVLALLIATVRQVYYRNSYGLPPGRARNLSWPSKQIVGFYRDLPVDNRPFPDIVPIVEAMDIKYGRDVVNRHYRHGWDDDYYDWTCPGRNKEGCTSYSCKFQEYKNLCLSIEEIIDSIKAQEKALTLAGMSDRLDEAPLLLERLREEKSLIDEVTKELTQ